MHTYPLSGTVPGQLRYFGQPVLGFVMRIWTDSKLQSSLSDFCILRIMCVQGVLGHKGLQRSALVVVTA